MVVKQLLSVIFFVFTCLEISKSVHNKHPVPFNKLATCQEFDVESKSCLHYFPVGSIKNYKNRDFKLQMKFYVMATNDANIVLTNGLELGKGRIAYTIVVAGFENTYSWIRNTTEVTVGIDSHLPKILSPLWPTPILVQVKYDGTLLVSIPDVAEPLMVADARDLTEINQVCIYAWNCESRWFYNCTELEDVFIEDESDCSHNKRDCLAGIEWVN
ncbi:uncharacterized protein LOC119651511 [Hermetia illucens]|uniref:uncharacterized protein LOC119651511 n=1 Tax=Hermetia illucens TaxID=343691 RepID=UPI0018CC1499|nr:uncharacterized protein LOC119651511 [Hermetia illucens]